MSGCDEKFLYEPDTRSSDRDSSESKGSYSSTSSCDEKASYSSNTSYDEKSSRDSTISDDEKALYEERNPPRWAHAFYNKLEDKPLPPLPATPQLRPLRFADKPLPSFRPLESRRTKYAKKPKSNTEYVWWNQRRHQLSDVKDEDEPLRSMMEREMAAAMMTPLWL